MTFDENEKLIIDHLPLVLRTMFDVLLNGIERILDGDCDEETAADTIATLHNNANARYTDNDLVTYDEAARILHMQVTNRNGLKKLLDAHGIQQKTLHNQKVGFLRTEIMALYSKLDAEKKKKSKKDDCFIVYNYICKNL